MTFSINRLKHIWRYRDWTIGRYLDEAAQVCRHSQLTMPVLIGPETKVKRSALGRYTYVARGTRIVNAEVGAYGSIGPECLIGGLGRHPTDQVSTSPITYSARHPLGDVLGRTGEDIAFTEEAPVTIGADVWIGARAMVLDGVTVGHGAIIGANTVVTKDVPPYAIVYGSPPRVQRYRFEPEVIARLLASQWWQQPVETLDMPALKRLLGEK
jgi:acetyltransferase-like isoleucine patch superfamily enzyme